MCVSYQSMDQGREDPTGEGQASSFPRGQTPGQTTARQSHAGSQDRGWRGQGGPFPPLHPTSPLPIPIHLHQPSLLGAPEHRARLTSSQRWLGPQGRDPTFCFPPRSPHPLDRCQRLQPLPGARGPGSARGRGLAFAAPRASSCWPSPSAPAPAGLSWTGERGRVRRCLWSTEKAKA